MVIQEAIVTIGAVLAVLAVLVAAALLARNPFELALYVMAGAVMVVLAGAAVWKVRT